jgi:uncharacterized protein (DUF1778 family)
MRETRTALPELVAEAAALDATNASEFMRRAVLAKLREIGPSRWRATATR